MPSGPSPVGRASSRIRRSQGLLCRTHRHERQLALMDDPDPPRNADRHPVEARVRAPEATRLPWPPTMPAGLSCLACRRPGPSGARRLMLQVASGLSCCSGLARARCPSTSCTSKFTRECSAAKPANGAGDRRTVGQQIDIVPPIGAYGDPWQVGRPKHRRTAAAVVGRAGRSSFQMQFDHRSIGRRARAGATGSIWQR